MAGNGRIARLAHDVANGAVSPRTAGGSCDITVRCDTAMGNASDDQADTCAKISLRHVSSSQNGLPIPPPDASAENHLHFISCFNGMRLVVY